MTNKPRLAPGLGLIDQAGKEGAIQPAIDHTTPGTKLHTILTALLSGSLNTFEAARIGDTCLHTTASVLRGKGYNVIGEWEEVLTRFGKHCRVKRHRIVEGGEIPHMHEKDEFKNDVRRDI